MSDERQLPVNLTFKMSIAGAFIVMRQTSARDWVVTFCNGYDAVKTIPTRFRPRIVEVDETYEMRKCLTSSARLPGTSDVRLQGISYRDHQIRYAARTFVDLNIRTIELGVDLPAVGVDSPPWAVRCERATHCAKDTLTITDDFSAMIFAEEMKIKDMEVSQYNSVKTREHLDRAIEIEDGIRRKNEETMDRKKEIEDGIRRNKEEIMAQEAEVKKLFVARNAEIRQYLTERYH